MGSDFKNSSQSIAIDCNYFRAFSIELIEVVQISSNHPKLCTFANQRYVLGQGELGYDNFREQVLFSPVVNVFFCPLWAQRCKRYFVASATPWTPYFLGCVGTP